MTRQQIEQRIKDESRLRAYRLIALMKLLHHTPDFTVAQRLEVITTCPDIFNQWRFEGMIRRMRELQT